MTQVIEQHCVTAPTTEPEVSSEFAAQPVLYPSLFRTGIWQGLPVVSHQGSLTQIRGVLPTFERRPFSLRPLNGRSPRENPRYDVIVRGAVGQPGLFDDEVPIALVSKRYALVQHTEIVDLVQTALTECKITETRALLQITENGERLALDVVLPQQYWFDPGDGHCR
jgi:hypothetical protein